MNRILCLKCLRLLALALVRFALAPVVQSERLPKPEDHGNGNSASVNVVSVNRGTTGNAWAGRVSSPAIWTCQWWDGRNCTFSIPAIRGFDTLLSFRQGTPMVPKRDSGAISA